MILKYSLLRLLLAIGSHIGLLRPEVLYITKAKTIKDANICWISIGMYFLTYPDVKKYATLFFDI